MDENRNVIIVGVALIFGVFFLSWVIFGGKSKDSPGTYPGTVDGIKKTDSSRDTDSKRPSSTRTSAHTYKFDLQEVESNVSPFSEDELKAMKQRQKESDKIISESAQNWLTSKVNDENLPEKVKEKYRLKTISSYVEGTNLKKQKNYPAALKAFMDALKDPNASPVSKYYTLLNMKTIALKMKDLDLFIAISKSEAELISEEDLKIIGISKSKEHFEWIENFEKMMKAKRDPSVMSELIQKRMVDGSHREEIENDIKAEIERYESIFKELMS
jgi:hypothetical protein